MVQNVMDAITQLRADVGQFRAEMNGRFDRIEMRISAV